MFLSLYSLNYSATLRRSAIAAAVLAALASAGTAQAQTKASDTFGLGEVEVIGVRESAITPMVVTTITAEELASKHRDDLAEALELVPGVNLQNLGQRRERLIYVRGFTSRQVPLFIDGVPVYVPYDGNVDLARFGVDYVSEISVSKGLASLLYGPNIMGGAVNVISRKPTAPFEGSARVTAEFDGRFDSMDQKVVGSLGGTFGGWYAHITASYVNSDGYRLPDNFNPMFAEDGGKRENADSRDTVVAAKIGYAPSELHEFALSYYRQEGEKQDPPYAGTRLRVPQNNMGTPQDGVLVRFWRWPYWDKESVYFVARNALGSKATLRWRLFHDSFKNSLESYDNATYTTQNAGFAFHGSNYDDYTFGGNGDLELQWTDAHATRVAVHYRNDVHRELTIRPATPEQRLEIATYGIAIEHEWRVTDAFTTAASYSHNIQPGETVQVFSNGVFRPVTTNQDDSDNGQLIGTYRLNDSHSLIAGVSQKTRFPTLKDRFSGGLGTTIPNPDLRSETARHYEVGYQFSASQWIIKAAVFHSDTDDAIQPVPATGCTGSPCTQLQNVGRQRHRGIESVVSYTPSDSLRLTAQANLLDVENRTSAQQPTGIPKRKFMLAGDWEFVTDWHLRLDAQHESERRSNSTSTRFADSFTLVNGFVRFTPIESIGLELGVRNATDKLYAYEEGFYEAGRSWLAQVDYRF